MMNARGLCLLAAALALAACGGEPVQERLPDVKLPTASAQEGPSLAACPTKKCFNVYVAPWCGYCRQATPRLIELRDYLRGRGVTTRFIVGKDRLEALRDYAREFGPDTLLDPDDRIEVSGVPHFFVTGQDGAILKETSGLPWGDYSLDEFAAFFGLP